MPPTVSRQVPPKAAGPPGNGTAGKAPGMAGRITAIDPGTGGMKVLLYGESGSGKTTTWATFPGPILSVLCSGGVQPGELKSIDTPEMRGKVSQLVVEKSADIREVVEYLKADGGRFKTVVLDHATGLADLVLTEILGVDELPAQRAWGQATQQQYGQQALQLKEAFRALLGTPGHVVVVAQQRTFGGKDDGMDPDLVKPTVGAYLSPSVTGWLNAAVDFVIQTFKRAKTGKRVTKILGNDHVQQVKIGGIEYCARTGPHEIYQTKFRIPRGRVLPECVVDPDFAKLQALVRGEN